MRPHYRIGKRTLPIVAGGVLIFIGLLLVAGPSSPTSPSSPSSPGARAPSDSTAPTGASSTANALTPIPPGYRIQIPRVGIDLAIAEGDVARDVDRQTTPEGFAFHLPGTSIPGLGGNTYLYAHARTGMFLSLWNVQPGDVVVVSTPDLRALKYTISEVHPRVPPEDVSWVQPTPSERLTLQTSTGPNATDPRFVAVAVPAATP